MKRLVATPAELPRDPDLQVRAVVSSKARAEYSALYKEYGPGALDALSGLQDAQGQIWIWDGYTRLAAIEDAGLNQVLIDVEPGTREDALARALERANRKHGEKLTPEDKERKVLLALKNPEYAGISYRELADRIGVNRETFRQVARRLEEAGQVTRPVTVKGKDGKTQAATKGRRPKEAGAAASESPAPGAQSQPDPRTELLADLRTHLMRAQAEGVELLPYTGSTLRAIDQILPRLNEASDREIARWRWGVQKLADDERRQRGDLEDRIQRLLKDKGRFSVHLPNGDVVIARPELATTTPFRHLAHLREELSQAEEALEGPDEPWVEHLRTPGASLDPAPRPDDQAEDLDEDGEVPDEDADADEIDEDEADEDPDEEQARGASLVARLDKLIAAVVEPDTIEIAEMSLPILRETLLVVCPDPCAPPLDLDEIEAGIAAVETKLAQDLAAVEASDLPPVPTVDELATRLRNAAAWGVATILDGERRVAVDDLLMGDQEGLRRLTPDQRRFLGAELDHETPIAKARFEVRERAKLAQGHTADERASLGAEPQARRPRPYRIVPAEKEEHGLVLPVDADAVSIHSAIVQTQARCKSNLANPATLAATVRRDLDRLLDAAELWGLDPQALHPTAQWAEGELGGFPAPTTTIVELTWHDRPGGSPVTPRLVVRRGQAWSGRTTNAIQLTLPSAASPSVG